MKFQLDIQDNKVAFFLELIKNFKFIKAKPVESNPTLSKLDVPEWHMREVKKRLEAYNSNGEALDFDQAMDDIEKGL